MDDFEDAEGEEGLEAFTSVSQLILWKAVDLFFFFPTDTLFPRFSGQIGPLLIVPPMIV